MVINRNLRRAIDSNLYISNFIKSAIGFSYNKKMESFTHKISEVDSIAHIDDFVEALKEIPNQIMGSTYSLKHSYGENTMYGYAEELLNYAGLSYKDIFYLPLLEHGISVPDFFQSSMKHPYIFECRYKEKLWNENSKGVHCYYVGPYIHYAKDYYEKAELNKEKEKLGKTVLVFPPHSTEVEGTDYSLEQFDKYLFGSICKKYDSIIACIFWANLNDTYVQRLKSRGVKIVSAGFKLDVNFVRRLKSIINLSDAVLYPSFTTSIGYAFYLGKKVICVYNRGDVTLGPSIAFTEKENDIINSGFEAMQQHFSRVFSEDAEPFSKEQRNLINTYWGLDEIKTPEEIRNIVKENKKRIITLLGF